MSGGYALTLQRINEPEQARTLYFPRIPTGTLDTSAAIGTFTFTADANSSVLLRMTALTSGLHPYVQIFSQDGTRLCSGLSYGASAEISQCLLPSAGDYTVLATSLDDGTGRYTLTLTCLNGSCGALTPPDEHIYLPVVRR